MAQPKATIDRLVSLGDGTIAVVVADIAHATTLLRRNPRAAVMEQDGEHILVYSGDEIDLSRAIKKL